MVHTEVLSQYDKSNDFWELRKWIYLLILKEQIDPILWSIDIIQGLEAFIPRSGTKVILKVTG